MQKLRSNWQPTVKCRVAVEEGTTSILTIGKTYKVSYWIRHDHGVDPVVTADNGKQVIMWSGLFHD